MLKMSDFGSELEKYGFDFYSGVPCSFLKSMINYAINNDQFVMAANEGDAVAICAGANLGGRKTIFLCQNSGLTNAVSPLTSLNYTFEIPVLGFVSLRGEKGVADEPQHELMGVITDDLLNVMKIENEVLSDNIEDAMKQLAKANEVIESGKSFFFIVKKDTFEKEKLNDQGEIISNTKDNVQRSNAIVSQLPKRIEVLKELKFIADEDTLLLATTGVTGRELFELGHVDNQFYMVGSMGCISSVALGLALARPDKKVVAIDGDGSLLMRMGSLATNAYYAPANLYHLLLDNALHESTGGQKTVSGNIDFLDIATGAGYPKVVQLTGIKELNKSLKSWGEQQQLTFGYIKTAKGIKENLGRPTLTPVEVKQRLMINIGGE